MEFEDIIQVKFGGLLGGDVRIRRDEVSHFGEAVDADKDGVQTAGRWQFDDQVHGDRLPCVRWDRERVQKAVGTMAGDFIAGTGITGPDVVVDESAHSWPKVVPGNVFHRVLLSQVPRGFGIVALL